MRQQDYRFLYSYNPAVCISSLRLTKASGGVMYQFPSLPLSCRDVLSGSENGLDALLVFVAHCFTHWLTAVILFGYLNATFFSPICTGRGSDWDSRR